ncbi:CHAT domain-containing protein [Cyanobacterium aponinum FACHB-4101]|nr:CHAT domain-containing protein [Cyanobacterium aponinum FACHB-4101]
MCCNSLSIVGLTAFFPLGIANAQITPDRTLGKENSIVTPNLTINGIPSERIDGGAVRNTNLFHSFQEFNIGNGRGVYFNNPAGIENIFTRITGQNVSKILGTLGVLGNGNLFLLNPNGIIFGPNATLDLKGSFIGSTADSIVFSNGVKFSATNPKNVPLLTIGIPIGLEFRANSGEISVQGEGSNLFLDFSNGSIIPDQRNTGLEVSTGKTLGLLGSKINITGGNLTADSGTIELWSVIDGNLGLTFQDQFLKVKNNGITQYGDIQLINNASVFLSGVNLGGINVYSQNLTLNNGSSLITLMTGNTKGEDLNIKISDSVLLTGSSANGFLSGFYTQTFGKGDAGNLTLETGNLTLKGALISASTFGGGNAGQLQIIARNNINLLNDGFNITSILADSHSSGNSQNVNIKTQNLTLKDGAQIAAGTFSQGNGGKLNIEAFDSIEIVGEGLFPSGFFTQSERNTTGNGGDLTVKTNRLIVKDGGLLSVGTRGSGEAGELIIDASESVKLTGTTIRGSGSRLISGTLGTGNGGNIILNTGTLTIQNGAGISVSSVFETGIGQGNPGNLNIKANSIFLNNKGKITAESGSGEGGNISLQAQERLELRNNSQISATAGTEGGDGNGGNIFIDSPFIIAPPNGDSDITANAFEGQGGNIIVNSQGIFGIEFRENQTPKSDITASSQFGRSGNVEISTPNVNPSQGLVELVKNPVNPADLVEVNACSKGQESEFIITGRGGLPPNPASILNGDLLLPDFGIANNSLAQQTKVTSVASKTPAQGWRMVRENEMVLTANTSSNNLIEKGVNHYENGQFQEAITKWQEALKEFEEDSLTQSIIFNNIAIALTQLGEWEKAEETVKTSQEILNNISNNSQLKQSIQAQFFNNLAIIELARGDGLQALKYWQSATQIYEQIGDQKGVIRSLINQSKALKYLGLNLQAKQLLQEINTNLELISDPLLKVAGGKNYGDVLRLLGDFSQSEQVLEKSLAIAQRLSKAEIEQGLSKAEIAQENLLPNYVNQIQLSLGNTYFAQNNITKALEYYQETDTNSPFLNLEIQSQLNKLKLLIQRRRFFSLKNLLPEIYNKINNLPPSNTSIYAQINFVNSLDNLAKITSEYQDFDKILILENALKQAQKIGDKRAEAYVLTYLGEQYEQQKQWTQAENTTKSALIITGQIRGDDIAYLAQWQLARILKAKGDKQGAITAYNLAFDTLKDLRNDLVTVNREVQFSFRESVEPIYRELVALLLEGDISQSNLIQAREIMESLQLAELDNFFKDTCSTTKPVQVDQIDPTTAVIYPIILRDRLDVIVSLPGQPLIHYSTPLNQDKVRQIVTNLQKALYEDPLQTGRITNNYQEDAQTLYQFLIQPIETKLQSNQIKNLTFVLDGILRNIPMAILYDGEKYLLEKYSIALTPGLQLLDPQPFKRTQLRALTAGLTEARQNFSALPNVKIELTEIENEINSKVLLNQEFTKTNLEKLIQNNNFPILHFATHGQFSSNIEDTFILTWDESINTKELDRILSRDFASDSSPLELLVLSACQTATGDERAALGLAGIAVRAGARSTLATLWLVDDRATTELMVKFYQELARTEVTKAEALRQAQLSLLKDGKHEHPFFWAPFVLVGNWL